MKEITIYYDGECPFCSKYSEIVALRSRYDVKLKNAREYPDKIEIFKKIGMDINSGFIIEIENTLLQGEDAVVFLSNDIQVKTLLGKSLLWLMRKKYFMNVVYPIVKVIRIVLLWIMGRSHRINFK